MIENAADSGARCLVEGESDRLSSAARATRGAACRRAGARARVMIKAAAASNVNEDAATARQATCVAFECGSRHDSPIARTVICAGNAQPRTRAGARACPLWLLSIELGPGAGQARWRAAPQARSASFVQAKRRLGAELQDRSTSAGSQGQPKARASKGRSRHTYAHCQQVRCGQRLVSLLVKKGNILLRSSCALG